jgi:hypothetical protein
MEGVVRRGGIREMGIGRRGGYPGFLQGHEIRWVRAGD